MPLGSSRPIREGCGVSCNVTFVAEAPSPAETSLATDDGKSDSFCSNASSRSLASAATRLFLAGRARPAQVTAESADVGRSALGRRGLAWGGQPAALETACGRA